MSILFLKGLERADDGHLKIPRSAVVWEWFFTLDAYNALSEPVRESLKAFLSAHGIEPTAFLDGNCLTVFMREHALMWLYTWRAVGNDARQAPMCPHCPSCIKQEEVLTPVVTALPAIHNADMPTHVTVPDRDDG